jgi:UDP-N-acetylglucosamine--N-acetylmuramyl-(pentapeptide) pyrophosphoryl-undecaprenol N-acetylglucosamine transferase
MDSNALPGFTNRSLARFVDKAALTFPEALQFFGAKGVLTGNPVRKEFFDLEEKERSANLCILIFGGSQGARAINDAMIASLPFLEVHKERIGITHQTGESDFEKVRAAYARGAWDNADVRPYISDMVAEFAEADIVICRAGATTCAELGAAGRASIMVPLPTAADDHQRKNAEAMVAAGAAKMILQNELRGERLADEIKNLLAAPEKLSEMGASAKKLARRDAADATVDLIRDMAEKNV